MIKKTILFLLLGALSSCSTQDKDENEAILEIDVVTDLQKTLSNESLPTIDKNSVIQENSLELTSYNNDEILMESEGPQEETD